MRAENRMTSFIDKDQAAILARALNRRRFGFFTYMMNMWRADVCSDDKQSRSGKNAEHPSDPLTVQRYQDRSV